MVMRTRESSGSSSAGPLRNTFQRWAYLFLPDAFFADSDSSGRPLVSIINQAFARKYFGDRDPIGRHIRVFRRSDASIESTVVGVVADIRNSSLEEAPPPQICSSFWQNSAYIAEGATSLFVPRPAEERCFPQCGQR